MTDAAGAAEFCQRKGLAGLDIAAVVIAAGDVKAGHPAPLCASLFYDLIDLKHNRSSLISGR